MTPPDWHQRYTQQARWTQPLREYSYAQVSMSTATRILDVGCGTGALELELLSLSQGTIFGLDIDPANLALAITHAPGAFYIQADAHQLPLPAGTFDIVFCHFLLLWVSDPVQVVREMRRLARPGGAVLALAEPDYAGRIDYPTEFALLGKWQRDALIRQGAQPDLGRRLGEVFSLAGLESIETGILGGQWKQPPTREEWELEWQVLENDLISFQQLEPLIARNEHRDDTGASKIPNLPDLKIELTRLKQQDWSAWHSRARILFVPTFYAWGKK
jgi:SAM-dependent methyltransferase